MKCPRCGNEWDASKGPCIRCGFALRMTGRQGPVNRSSSFPQSDELQSGKMSSANPPSSSSGTPPAKELSSGMRPTPTTPSLGRMSSVRPPSSGMPSPPPASTPWQLRPIAHSPHTPLPPPTDSLTLDHRPRMQRTPQVQQTQQAPLQQQPERNRLITVPLST
jgi:hypothetical protein